MPNEAYVVIRQEKGGRPLLAFQGAVYHTHSEAMNAMRKHRDALSKYSPHDGKSLRVKKSSNPKRIR